MTEPTAIYIAGPMTGLPDHNYPAFHAAARQLAAQYPDATILNPAGNFGGRTDLPWTDYMRAAITQMMQADMVCMLPGWDRSRGAAIEHRLAFDLEMPIMYQENRD